jgi:DNA mismatch endonuclease, patch repair protein
MAKIGPKNSSYEILVRKFLRSRGLKYKAHYSKLVGKPDIILPIFRSIVFIHGCFWHGHKGCYRSTLPTTRREFWKKKISGNVNRDKKIVQELKRKNWKVFVVWQCKLRNVKLRQKNLEKLVLKIRNGFE